MESNKHKSITDDNIYFPFNYRSNILQINNNEGFQPFNFSQFFALEKNNDSCEQKNTIYDENEDNLNSDLSTNMSNKSSDSIKMNSRKNSYNKDNDVSSMLSSFKEINIQATIEVIKYNTDNKKKKEIKLSEFIKSQKGSRIYQRKVKKMSILEIDEVISELLNYIPVLLTNVYANYFCQKLFSLCNIDQKLIILDKITSSIRTIAKDYCGSHALQSLIISIEDQREKDTLRVIFEKDLFIELSLDQYGCYVIQKIFKVFDIRDKDYLSYVIINNFDLFIYNQYGSKLVKNIISDLSEHSQKLFIKLFISNILHYSKSEYACDVLQNILKIVDNNDFMKDLITCILNNIIIFCNNKFSCNIIISMIENDIMRNRVVYELFNNHKLCFLTKNKYGILVVKSLIRYLSNNEKKSILSHLNNQKECESIKLLFD